jgi:type III pantothenate kinase
MILAVDCGNTRVKWGLHPLASPRITDKGIAWIKQGTTPLGAWRELAGSWDALPTPERIVIANVAGPAAQAELSHLLERWKQPAIWVTAQSAACGVTNGYADPVQLGADRWAALIAAWARHPGTSLVVSAGTATTVDTLRADGVFEGGMILPGVELMKRALASYTAALPFAAGHYTEAPRDTADAIESGCLSAQAGAIERSHARLPQGAPCFLCGGAAGAIAARLNIPATVVDNLVLEGLLRLSL